MKKENRIGTFGMAALVALLLGSFARIQTAAAQFAVLHNFIGYPSDGAWPQGSLTLSDSAPTGWGGCGNRTCVVSRVCTRDWLGLKEE